ncbi:hypothetical protein ES703_65178 [subsurface metagenome]
MDKMSEEKIERVMRDFTEALVKRYLNRALSFELCLNLSPEEVIRDFLVGVHIGTASIDCYRGGFVVIPKN